MGKRSAPEKQPSTTSQSTLAKSVKPACHNLLEAAAKFRTVFKPYKTIYSLFQWPPHSAFLFLPHFQQPVLSLPQHHYLYTLTFQARQSKTLNPPTFLKSLNLFNSKDSRQELLQGNLNCCPVKKVSPEKIPQNGFCKSQHNSDYRLQTNK